MSRNNLEGQFKLDFESEKPKEEPNVSEEIITDSSKVPDNLENSKVDLENEIKIEEFIKEHHLSDNLKSLINIRNGKFFMGDEDFWIWRNRQIEEDREDVAHLYKPIIKDENEQGKKIIKKSPLFHKRVKYI